MKVLIDECLPRKLRLHFTKHQAVTAVPAGFGGLKNGALLDAAEAAGFDVVVTGGLSVQLGQNIMKRSIGERKLGVVSLSAQGWQIVRKHTAAIAAAVDHAKPGELTRDDVGAFSRKRR